jgi:hypothetical protein
VPARKWAGASIVPFVHVEPGRSTAELFDQIVEELLGQGHAWCRAIEGVEIALAT